MSRHTLDIAVHELRARRPKPHHTDRTYQLWRIACVKTGRDTRYTRVGEVAEKLKVKLP